MGTSRFWGVSFIVSLVFLVLTRGLISNEYYFFAGYQVLQFIVLATAWNILGGYTGYTNFGTGAFFAIGAYTAVVLHKTTSLPVPVMMLIGGVMSGIVGFGMGYLTLRLRGVFFAICVLGGMTSFPGMLAGALLIGIVESITATFYGPSWAPAVAFGFLLLTLAVRPAGILGR